MFHQGPAQSCTVLDITSDHATIGKGSAGTGIFFHEGLLEIGFHLHFQDFSQAG